MTAWRALEDLYLDGKIKAIGVSNFQISHLETLLAEARVVPAINQVELHPRLSQIQIREFGKKHGIHIEAWSPLMQGELLNNETIVTIAKKYNKSAAQIILRWDVQNEVITIPKSVKRERMIANADLFDFELTTFEMIELNNMNMDTSVGPDPDTFDFA